MVTNLARAWSQRFTQPLASLLARAGLTPNAITVLGCLLTGGVAILLATGRLWLSGLLLIVTLGLDAVDGTLARLTGQVTRFGAFLDSTLDRWAEIFLYIALGWHFLRLDQDMGVMLTMAAMATSLLVSYTRARAEGAGFTCSEGLMTRLERLVILILGLIVNQIIWALWIIAILSGFTALQRIWVTWQTDRRTR
jgi:CDP-diacylglycerol--glycerol-3-phosphate 3-phosphatidyltransferase